MNKLLSLCRVIKWYFTWRKEAKEHIKCSEEVCTDGLINSGFNPWDSHYIPDSFSWKARSGANIKKDRIQK